MLDLAQLFSCEFCETFKNTFFIKHLRWLLPELKSINYLHNNLNWSKKHLLLDSRELICVLAVLFRSLQL